MTTASSAWIAATLGIGVVLGVALCAWWMRRAAPGATSAAREGITVPAIGTGDALPPFPVEIHLVLNVLNRLVMTLSHDEHAQEGAAALADYLAALSRMRSSATPADPATANKPVEMYLCLSEWQHRREPAVMGWNSTGTLTAPARVWTLIDEVQQSLRGLEGLKVSDVRIDVELRGVPDVAADEGAGHRASAAAVQPATLVIRATELPGGETIHADHPMQRGWTRDGNGRLSVTRTLSL